LLWHGGRIRGGVVQSVQWLGYWPYDRCSMPDRKGIFLFAIASKPALRTIQPPIQQVPGVKRQRREADHAHSSSAEVRNTWSYVSTPHTSSWRDTVTETGVALSV
jgi:hypothetical protein